MKLRNQIFVVQIWRLLLPGPEGLLNHNIFYQYVFLMCWTFFLVCVCVRVFLGCLGVSCGYFGRFLGVRNKGKLYGNNQFIDEIKYVFNLLSL